MCCISTAEALLLFLALSASAQPVERTGQEIRTGAVYPAGPKYVAVDLGYGRCTAVSDTGWVAGLEPEGGAFRISMGGGRELIADWSAKSGTPFVPTGIDDRGRVAAYRHPVVEGRGATVDGRLAFVYDGEWKPLGRLAGGEFSVTGGMNGAGDIAGYSGILEGPSKARPAGDLTPQKTQAFLHRAGGLTPLPAGGLESEAVAVSSDSRVAGVVRSAGGATRAFLWEAGKGRDLGTLGGLESRPFDVNVFGEVVGVSEDKSGARIAFLFTEGKMTSLGTLKGDAWSEAHAISDGTVIGGSSGVADVKVRPFVWLDGKMLDVMPRDAKGPFFERAGIEAGNFDARFVGYGVVRVGEALETRCLAWLLSAKP